MLLKNLFMLTATGMILLSCAKEADEHPDNSLTDNVVRIEDEDADDTYQSGIVNIYLSEDLADAIEAELSTVGVVTKASSEGLSSLYDELGIISMERLFQDAGEFEERVRREGLHRWYKVKYDTSISTTKAAGGFEGVDGVEIVEKKRKIKSTSFNDPYLYRQWGFINDGSLSSSHKSGADINVSPVWEKYTTGSSNVIVAVVDGGIEYTHEDLASNYVGGFNFVNSSSTVSPHSHGTHVAGTVAAVNNNGTGVCGVAGGDYANGVTGVGLLSCQIFMTDTDGGDDLSGDGASAIVYGANHGAVICQNSWGYSYDSEAEAANGSIASSLREAVDYFIKYAGCDNNGSQLADSPMKGGLVVFAAGNDGWQYGPPANYDPIIAVGSIAPDFSRAYYSNYGDWVDICAPGGSSSYGENGYILSTTVNGQYTGMQGTSMACPHVSGVAALLVSYYGGAGFTNEMLEEKLIGGANSTKVRSTLQIGPLVDAYGSFTYGDTTPPDAVTSYTVSSLADKIDFTWDVTADGSDVAYSYVLMATTDAGLYDGISMKSIPSGIAYTTVTVDGLVAGDEMTGRLSGLSFSTQYYVAICGYDYAGNYSDLSPIKTTSTTENNAPVVSTEYTGSFTLASYATLTVPYSVTDPDDHSITVTYYSGSDADTFTRVSAGVYNLVITAPAADAGNYEGTVSVADYYGATTTYPISYTIQENHAPTAIKEPDDKILTTIGSRLTLTVTDYIEDQDGETPTWSVTSSNSNVAYANLLGTTLTVTSLSYGTTTVSITGTDAKGENCTVSFRVAVVDSSTASVVLYPNPVSDTLYVMTGEEMETTIKITSATGKKMYETTQNVSLFDPATIDVSSFAPGRYSVTVKFGSTEATKTMAKI